MKIILILGIITTIIGLVACKNHPKEKSDKEIFEEVLSAPTVNSKEVGEGEGIKYFQVLKDGKTGFRDLDGNIVIQPEFDAAEMFSEGFSAVKLDNKWGLIDETGKYVLKPQYDYLGSVHNGLASYREADNYGFINTKGHQIIKPQFEWVDEFSEGLCVVRNDKGKHGYIDTTGDLVIEFQFQHANKFENAQAKVELNNFWGAIDKTGKFIVPATHKYASDW